MIQPLQPDPFDPFNPWGPYGCFCCLSGSPYFDPSVAAVAEVTLEPEAL